MKELYFSRLLLSGALHDLHDVHSLLWRAFRSTTPEDVKRPFLFRADRVVVDERRRAWKVLVQATRAGRWADAGDALIEHEERQRRVTLLNGERLRFFVRANATRATMKGHRFENLPDLAGRRFRELPAHERKRTRGLRLGLRTEEELVGWLDRQAKLKGFELARGSSPDAAFAVRIAQKQRETWNDRGRNAVHEGADMEGNLVVRDAEKLLGAVIEGLGSGRAFGFGLLSLAREL